MNSTKEYYNNLFWIAVGMLLAAALELLPWTYRSIAYNAKEQCEQALPRNQECVITAIQKEQIR